MNGKVKFYNAGKHFGFITGEDGKDYFVHASDLGDGVMLNDDDAVTFDVEEGERGPKAVKVQKGEAAAEAPAEPEAAEEPSEASEDTE